MCVGVYVVYVVYVCDVYGVRVCVRKGGREVLEEGPAPSENRPSPTSLGLGRTVKSKGLSPTDLSPSPKYCCLG